MRRVSIFSLLVLSPYTASAAGAQTGNVQHLIRESAEAIGGLERLRALHSIRIEETGGEYLVSTITRADAPPKVIAQTMTTLRSLSDTAIRRTTIQSIPMRTGRITSTTLANRGVAASVRGAGLFPGGAFDSVVVDEELRLSPERVLLTALDASDVRLG